MSQKSNKSRDFIPYKNAIPLVFTKDNLVIILSDIVNGTSMYSHQDLANWATNFWNYLMQLRDKGEDVDDNLEELLIDIDMQFDGFLTANFSLEELQTLDKSKVKLPKEWFEQWLKQLKSHYIG